MKSKTGHTPPQEIELKLSLPGANTADLAKCLGLMPLLARRKASTQSLYNIYFDTPDQALRQQRAVLRLRRVGSEAKPQWLQTLKTGASDTSALSRRGEWETPVAGPVLDRQALKHTLWADMDPDLSLFKALAPCFSTSFERTSWLIRRRDGTAVELALDIGQIEADGKHTPICELELELKAGQPAALFAIAQEIAQVVAVLPANQSKAQRGFLLAQDGLDQPQRGQTSGFAPQLTKPGLAQQVLRDAFAQFTMNLNVLCTSDDPEVVHQARVGWRRFKSGLRLFRKIPRVATAPSRLDLQPLLSCLGSLRNLDVALNETLPPLSAPYAAGDEPRATSWQALMTELAQAAVVGRKAVRYALQEPSVGANLLLMAEWLESLPLTNTPPEQEDALRRWAKRRVLRLHAQLKAAQQVATTPEAQHRVRILAKRLRYGVQALRALLPKRLAAFCLDHATSLQGSLGNTRDMAQASVLVATLDVEPAITSFLRGVAVGASVTKLSLN